MAKIKTVYFCTSCGNETPKWQGKCPACGENIVRYKFAYGCSGYKNGCKLQIGMFICGRVIPVGVAKQLLENRRTEKLSGFISKNGKAFDAYLKIDGDKCVFDFDK